MTTPQPLPQPTPPPPPPPPTPTNSGMGCVGRSRIYKNDQIWLAISGIPSGSPSDVDRIYFPPSTLPAGITVTYYGSNGAPIYMDNGVPWNVIADAPMWLRFNITQALPYGQISFKINVYGSGPTLRQSGAAPNVQFIPIVLNLCQCPEAILPNHVPGFETWQSLMLTDGSKWGDQILNWQTNGLGTQNWYYDLGRVFFQIQEYTNIAKYRDYALASLDSYIAFINAAGGALQGYEVFSRGLRFAYEKTADSKYLNAWTLMRSTPWVQRGGSPDPQFIRETTYAAEYWMENERFGNPRNPLAQQAIEFLMGHLDCLFRQELGKGTDSPINQPFFAGLAMEALIDWFELTWDERVVDIVKDVCDYIWEHGVDQNTGGIIYDLWRTPSADNPYYCSLNNMIVPAFGWLSKVLSSQLHAQRGDFLFSNFNNLEGIGAAGAKTYSQNYRWSPKFLSYRGAL